MRDPRLDDAVRRATAELDVNAAPRAARGFDPAEVEAFFDSVRGTLAAAEDWSLLSVVAAEITEARFTPSSGGLDATAVRGVLLRTAARLREASSTAGSEVSDVDVRALAEREAVRILQEARAQVVARASAPPPEPPTPASPPAAALSPSREELAHVERRIAEARAKLNALVRELNQLRIDGHRRVEEEVGEYRRRLAVAADAERRAADNKTS